MNTSRRRAPGIAWAITAGLLYGAVGIGTCPPAVADDSGRGPSSGTDIDAPGTDGAGNDSGPRRHGRDNKGTPSGNIDTGGSAGSGAWHPGDPCPWWPVPRPVPPPAPISGGNNNSGFIAAAPVVPAIPVPVFGDRAALRADIGSLPEDLPALSSPVAAAPAAGPAAPGVLPSPVPRVVITPAAPRPPAPAAVPVPRAVMSPPAAPPPPPQRPDAGLEPPAPVRLGYPADLRDADLARIVSMALPGLAALLGLTAFGGLVGYRQARAGYVLRAAGAGRFLQ